MTIPITREEKAILTRATLDRILYCKGYREELEKLNNKYSPHNTTNFTYAGSDSSEKEFLFPIDKAIH